MAEILLIEPFYGGSHKQLIDTIYENVEKCVKFTLPAKKWHWRARTSALYFSENIPASDSYRVLFASAVLNLAELVALRPDLARLKKVIYFHENQLVYPVRKQQDRDFQYGYNQILSCLVADSVVFNSHYNLTSFLASIDSFLKLVPDHRPRGLAARIATKSSVLYFPLALPPPPSTAADGSLLETRLASADQTRSSQIAVKGSDTLQDDGPSLGVQCGEVDVGSAGSSRGSPHQKGFVGEGMEGLGDSEDLGVDLRDLGHNKDSPSEVSDELKDPRLSVKGLGRNRDSHIGKTDRRLPDSGQVVKHQTDSSHPGTEVQEGRMDDDGNCAGNTQASPQQTRSMQQREELPKDLKDSDPKTGTSVHIQFPSTNDRSECTENYDAMSKCDQKSKQSLDPSLEGSNLASDQKVVQESAASSANKDAQNVVDDRSAEMGLQKKNLEILSSPAPPRDSSSLHIVWPHRWEHDKDPESFFAALYTLQQEGLSFQVSVLGEQFTEVPGVFGEARERLGGHIAHWGFQPSKTAFLAVLASAHVVVSTALHEFYGVAMLEAVHAGCFPLCPKRLVYPEIFPKECLYNTQQQLVKKLRHFCQRPHLVQRQRPQIDLERFSWRTLQASYKTLLSA